MGNDKQYWFPAKAYGWGWGFPCAWQGWVVLAAYLGVVIGISIWSNPEVSPAHFFAAIGAATAVLLVICAVKGERPRWRWGK